MKRLFIWSRSLHVKWRLVGYFLASMLIIAGGLGLGWQVWNDALADNGLWFEYAVLVVACALAVFYMFVQKLQRKIDTIHLAILQLANGNLGERIPASGNDPFNRMYHDFNKMASSLETRIKLLQKVGEENVMLQAQANEAAVIEERKRLARDLHDTVSQQIFAIHMSASSVAKLAERGQMEKAVPLLTQLAEMSHLAQKQLRGMIAQLRPIELEGRRLAEALDRWFPDYCRQNGLQGSMDIRLPGHVSDGIERQLFLIVQEAMANVVKHASARHVALTLHDNGNQYVLTVSDDGQGFQEKKVRVDSYGLSTMRERALKLGGDLELWSKEGAGTRIKVSIPKFEPEPESEQETDGEMKTEEERDDGERSDD